jgi:hypothetical protein
VLDTCRVSELIPGLCAPVDPSAHLRHQLGKLIEACAAVLLRPIVVGQATFLDRSERWRTAPHARRARAMAMFAGARRVVVDAGWPESRYAGSESRREPSDLLGLQPWIGSAVIGADLAQCTSDGVCSEIRTEVFGISRD